MTCHKKPTAFGYGKAFICLFILFLSLSSKQTYAQSDLCGSAPSIAVNSTYAPIPYDLAGFTNDGPALYTGTSHRDGWFTFTTSASATGVLITAIGDASPPIAVSTYLNCSDMTAQASIVPGSKTAILYASVSPNTTYLLRISRTSSGATGSTGIVCVQNINAVVSTYVAGDLSTEYSATEPNASSTNSCAGSMSVNIPAGNAATTVSTLYHMRATSPALMNEQRSFLYCNTTSTGESSVTAGTGTASNTEKYERHNLTFAAGATGSLNFNLRAWRTAYGSGCNTTYNKVTQYTWTLVVFYEPASSCASPQLNTFNTISNSTTTASISWGEPMVAPLEGYEYVYSTSNTTPTGSGTPLLSGTQINLSSLSAATNYYLFVRSKCSSSDFGNWTEPYQFNTTVCISSTQCNYSLQMNNVTPSGWNGTVIGFRQSGVVVGTATLTSGSSGSVNIPLCDNVSTEIFVQHAGSYSDEISFTLYNASSGIEHTHNTGNTLTTNTILDSFTSHCPDCLAPTSIVISYPSSTSIGIQWTASLSSPTDGYEYVVSTSNTYPSGSGTAVPTGTSAIASSLNASTNYFVFVRSKCSSTEASPWVGPIAITTTCADSSLPLNQGLNSASLACWETVVVTDVTQQSGISPMLEYVTSSNNPSGLSAFEGTGFIRFNSYNCDTGDQIRMISAPVSTNGLSSVDVDFIWSHDPEFATSNDGVQLQYSLDKITWINAGSFIPRFSQNIADWSPQSVTLPAGATNQTHLYVGFLFTSQGGNNCFIDDVVIRETPACKKPTNVKADHVTANYGRIVWTAPVSAPSSGYVWELRTSGAAGSGATGLVATGNTAVNILQAEISGLSSLTSYIFYVRANCGSEMSDWTWHYNFTTVAPIINSFPYDETYEVSSTTRAGWQNEFAYGSWNWTYAAGAGSGDVTTAHTGTLNARFRSTTDITYTTKLVSPPMDLTVLPSGARLKFWYANQSWSGRQNELRVYYKTTYGGAWTLIPNAIYTSNQNSWTEVTLILPQSGSDYYIAFEGLNKNSRGIVVDDVRIEPIECPIPTVDAVAGRNSAFIYWSLPVDASSIPFEWEIRTAGEPGSGASGLKATGMTNPGVMGRNVGGLTANTTYYLYARTYCSETDISLWSPAFEFTTTNIAPPGNDHITSSIWINAASFVYPNCLNIQGTTIGATPYFHQDYNDVWYKFVATSNGASIALSNASFDGALILMDGDMNIISTENITSNGQAEILNSGDLIAGNTYYVAVSNFRPSATADGTFSLCMKKLLLSQVTPQTYTLCHVLKPTNSFASTYTFTFTPTGSTPGAQVSYTTNSNISTLSLPQLGLTHSGTYSVKVDGTFLIADGNGNVETIVVPGTTINSIAIAAAPEVQLKPSLSCSNNVTLHRYSSIQGVGVTQGNICGVANYTVEFVRVADCNGNEIDYNQTIVVNTSNASTTLPLSSVFTAGSMPVSNNPVAGFWRVRWKPNFFTGGGDFGPERIIKVNNTSSTEMTIQNSGDLLSDFDTSDIATTIYPNPNNGESLNIGITGSDAEIADIKIYDSMGRTIFQSQLSINANYTTQVNFTQKLSAGIYTVEYTIDEFVKKDKLLIVK